MSELLLTIAALFPAIIIIFCACHFASMRISEYRQIKYNGIIKSIHTTKE
jgi:hypothetical protein